MGGVGPPELLLLPPELLLLLEPPELLLLPPELPLLEPPELLLLLPPELPLLEPPELPLLLPEPPPEFKACTVREKGRSEALETPSVAVITMLEYVPIFAFDGTP